MMTKNKKVKVCYVVCYKDPNYTRTNSLINALKTIDNIELIVVKNQHKGFGRYLKVPFKLLITRLRFRPDVFVVGFRAHEIFWAFYPSMIGKKIIFDEFIDHHDWIINEHDKFGKANKAVVAVLDAYMKIVMKQSKYVLTDTEAHAKLCAENYKVPPEKVKPIPVGADETFFYPRKNTKQKHENLEVLFYGSMLSLHGTDVILGAVVGLVRGGRQNIRLTIVGGDKNFVIKLKSFCIQNSLEKYIKHIPWVDYDKLPEFISAFDLCLGGPFGNTSQSKRVITGKTYQSLSMAKPVVVGKIDGMDGFRDKANSLVVKQGSAKTLADSLVWAIDNKSELETIGRRGHQLFKAKFSSVVIGKELKTLIS